jgi:hypothetical protein
VSPRRQVGRPRRVTDADVAAILAWHASRETQRALARRLGLSVRVVSRVIQTQGLHYKTPSPTVQLSLVLTSQDVSGDAGESLPDDRMRCSETE